MLIFSLVGMLLTYVILRLQHLLPLNPQGFGAVAGDLAFNTAASFTTNTNWQNYGGETTLSYLSQMVALAFHNFVSAAAGIAIAAALVRGIARDKAATLGNFWIDLTRSCLYLLLPICLVFAVFLVSQGMIQNFSAYQTAKVLDPYTTQVAKKDAGGQEVKDAKGNPVMEDVKVETQTIPQGPVASQVAIKMLGTNGGGFFNANAAHPFENPTPLSNFLQMLSIFVIPARPDLLPGPDGEKTRSTAGRCGPPCFCCSWGGADLLVGGGHGNPRLTALGVDPSDGNMEGKEVRFGIFNSALFATVTTDASCGAVNSMHDSFTPLGGLVPLFNIQLGEVIFGGVGAGLYGMLVFVVLAVFLAGLMVGRTPEYLGKKIESFDVKVAALAILVPIVLSAGLHRLGASSQWGVKALNNAGPHGFSEMLYAFTSCIGNNGSAFAGLSANTPWYNLTLGLAMLIGRFFAHRAGAGPGRQPGAQEDRAPERRQFPGFRPHVRSAAHRHRADRRGVDFLPGNQSRPHCGTLLDDELQQIVLRIMTMAAKVKARSLFDKTILIPAIWDSFRKLDPRLMVRNPVMFVTMVGAVVTTAKLFYTPLHGGSLGFFLQIALWLWFTVLFANFAEAMAEGRGKAQAATLRKARTQTMANRRLRNGAIETIPAESLRKDDIFVVKAGEPIPADGEVIEGAATVDESAITGESAPVIREAGGDRSAVTGGTRVLSDEIVVRVTANPGESFMDRMIALIEGASRQKTPNEIALTILLAALTIIFLVVIVTLKPFGAYAGGGLLRAGAGRPAGLPDSHHHRRALQRHRHRRH